MASESNSTTFRFSPLGGGPNIPSWRQKRHWIWLPFALLPATTIFPFGDVLLQLERLGRPVGSFYSASLVVALFALLITLGVAISAIERLQSRVNYLEAEMMLRRSADAENNA